MSRPHGSDSGNGGSSVNNHLLPPSPSHPSTPTTQIAHAQQSQPQHQSQVQSTQNQAPSHPPSSASSTDQKPNSQRIEVIKKYYQQLVMSLRTTVQQLTIPDLPAHRRQALLQQQEQLQRSLKEFTDRVLRPLANTTGNSTFSTNLTQSPIARPPSSTSVLGSSPPPLQAPTPQSSLHTHGAIPKIPSHGNLAATTPPQWSSNTPNGMNYLVGKSSLSTTVQPNLSNSNLSSTITTPFTQQSQPHPHLQQQWQMAQRAIANRHIPTSTVSNPNSSNPTGNAASNAISNSTSNVGTNVATTSIPSTTNATPFAKNGNPATTNHQSHDTTAWKYLGNPMGPAATNSWPAYISQTCTRSSVNSSHMGDGLSTTRSNVTKLPTPIRVADIVENLLVTQNFSTKHGPVTSVSLEPNTEACILKLADAFVDRVTRNAVQLARHRQSKALEKKDLELALEANFGLVAPGSNATFMGANKRYPKRPASGMNPHQTRMTQLKKYFASTSFPPPPPPSSAL